MTLGGIYQVRKTNTSQINLEKLDDVIVAL